MTDTLSETYGNSITSKHHVVLRLVGQNIGCLGVRTFANQTQEQGKEWLLDNHVDICCWQELDLSLHMLKHHEKLNERMRDSRWSKIRLSSSNNKHESIEKLQFVGTMVMAVNEAASRAHASGVDETGLGRWSWILFEGNNKYRTRVISAYVPCKPATRNDATVYMQHKRYFESKGIQTCPRRLMITQLTDQIELWTSKGEHIVLFIDANENLNKNGPLQRVLTGEKCNLVDPIRAMYPATRPSPTYHRNRSYPIDSVFVSRRLRHIHKGGWLRFGEGIGDHRVIYMDTPMSLLLGENKSQTPPRHIRRLKCNDPKVVRRFNMLLEEQYRTHNTLERIEALNRSFHIPLTESEQFELEKIDRISTCAVLYADKRCRKLNMGNVPFSDVIHKADESIWS